MQPERSFRSEKDLPENEQADYCSFFRSSDADRDRFAVPPKLPEWYPCIHCMFPLKFAVPLSAAC